jgi:hypothetical protein
LIINDQVFRTRKFYKRLNEVRRPFEPQVAMCRAKNGELLTNKNQVLARWKEHFEEHLNEGSESEQPTRPVDLRDDGVDIDLPSREEIEGALRYLKNNKAAGADSIAAELLKNGRPNLVDTLCTRNDRTIRDVGQSVAIGDNTLKLSKNLCS